MKIILYQNSSAKNVVHKQIGYEIEVNNCRLMDDTDLYNPKVELKVPTEIKDAVGYNYCYIPEFSRYYYIENIVFLSGKTIRLECNVDVLMSFSVDFSNTTQYVSRQEKTYNKYIPDSKFNIRADDEIDVTLVGNDIIENNENFLVTTVG